jgi:hypothetical protein
MESQEVMMDNFVNYSHVNPLKEPNQPCECQCVAYRLKGLKWFRENVEVIFAGLLEDGRVNHYHQGSVSHAEGSHLYEFGEQRMSSVIWRKICQDFRGLFPGSPTPATRNQPHRLPENARDFRTCASTAQPPQANPTAVDQSAENCSHPHLVLSSTFRGYRYRIRWDEYGSARLRQRP